MILSIDTSLASSGYCIGNPLGTIVEYGKIPTNKDDFEDEHARINYIGDKIEWLINKLNITEMVLENQFTSTNSKTILSLRLLCGVIDRIAYEHNIKITYYYPSSWRKILGINKGKANDKKLSAYNYVISQGVDIGEFKPTGKNKNDDICDAIAIYFAYIKDRGNK